MNCEICNANIDLPIKRWIKQEIVINDNDESCVNLTGYCADCMLSGMVKL